MAKKPYLPELASDGMPGSSRTLIERTYLQLRRDIVEGRLAPDEKLRVEHLKDRYAVSAGTLREAISRLVSNALVVAEGQRGFRVAPMSLDDLLDLTRLRVHIEIDALRTSIRQGDAAWRAELQAAYDAISAFEQPLAPELAARWEVMNSRFHEALIAGCRSPWTLDILRHLSQHTERYRRYAIGLPATGRDVHAEHTQIFEAAMSGQEARASLALEAHIGATPEQLRRHYPDGRLIAPVEEASGRPPDSAGSPESG
jgi:DNA-binding GntR family transcriptional regulator